MPYNITKSDGTFLVSVADASVNQTVTTIKLIGRAFPHYGDELNNNLVHMLEHFASSTPPILPLRGQIWYDTTSARLKYWTGTIWDGVISDGTASTGQYVQIVGDTMTGQLLFNRTPGPGETQAGVRTEGIDIRGSASNFRFVDYQTSTGIGFGRRWSASCTNEAETGSNAGSNYGLYRWNDNDTLNDYVLKINRATGIFDFNNNRLTNISPPLSVHDAVTKEYVDTLVSGGVGGGFSGVLSVGAVIASATALLPPFLLCDGTAVSRTTYSTLFSKIGTMYGAGNGTTTFNLPNLKSRFPLGFEAGVHNLATTGGAETVALTISNLASHTHSGVTNSSGIHSHNVNGPTRWTENITGRVNIQSTGSGGTGYSDVENPLLAASAGDHTHAFTTGGAGLGTAHENMPPYLTLYWYIASENVGGSEQNGPLIGEIKMYSSTITPPKWLGCDGSTVPITTYQGLYDIIGTAFNIGGEPVGYFRLPNLLGRFPAGLGNSGTTGSANINLGQYGGTAQHQLTIPEMPSHTHTYQSNPSSLVGTGIESGNDFNPNATRTTAATGGNQTHNNMPPFLGLSFIIYAGI